MPVSYDAAWRRAHDRNARRPRWSMFMSTWAIVVIIALGAYWCVTAETVFGRVLWAVYVAAWVAIAPAQRRRTRDLIRLESPPQWYSTSTLAERVLYRPSRRRRR